MIPVCMHHVKTSWLVYIYLYTVRVQSESTHDHTVWMDYHRGYSNEFQTCCLFSMPVVSLDVTLRKHNQFKTNLLTAFQTNEITLIKIVHL